MTWDKATPAGTDQLSTVDDRIRELKMDLEKALRANDTDGVVGKFPGSDTANPTYEYRGRRGTTASKPAAGSNGLYANADTRYLERDNGSSWDPIAQLLPAGAILDYAGSSAPTGFLICDGSAVSRTTYSDLFAVISTTYGVGDNSTTFNLPDLRGRTTIGVGQGSGLTNRALAATTGEETHQLSEAELASHTHSAGTLAVTVGMVNTNPGTGGTIGITDDNYTKTYDRATTYNDPNTSVSGSTGSAGSGTAHNNMQPSIALNKIIKT